MEPMIPDPPDSPRLFRPRGIGEILQHAFEIYREHWKNLIALVAIIVAPLTILQVFISDRLADAYDVSQTVNGELVVNGSLAAVWLGALATGVLSILTFTILTGAITRAAALTFLGRDLDIAESYRFGLARFWSIVLVGLLFALAVIGGFILLIIPGIYFAIRFSLSVHALVIEGHRGTAALKRSWGLVGGLWWHAFGALFVAAVLAAIVSGVLTAPFGSNLALRAIGQTIGQIITMPFTALVGVLLYIDVRVRKERYDPVQLEADLARSA
jgi:hypothetical protein